MFKVVCTKKPYKEFQEHGNFETQQEAEQSISDTGLLSTAREAGFTRVFISNWRQPLTVRDWLLRDGVWISNL